MTKQIKGFCKYCGKEYTKSGMVKHLAACKERKTILENAKVAVQLEVGGEWKSLDLKYCNQSMWF